MLRSIFQDTSFLVPKFQIQAPGFYCTEESSDLDLNFANHNLKKIFTFFKKEIQNQICHHIWGVWAELLSNHYETDLEWCLVPQNSLKGKCTFPNPWVNVCYHQSKRMGLDMFRERIKPLHPVLASIHDFYFALLNVFPCLWHFVALN